MPEVVFYPQNKSINVEEGTTILQAARSGKCKVRLDEKSLPNVLAKSRHYLSSRLNLAKTSKMALSKY